jgi:acyl carrier protein
VDPSTQIRDYIIQNFYVAEPAALAASASLLDKGIIDSTGVLEVIAFLEKTYAIRVEDEEMVPENLDSISNITAFVARKTVRPAP